MRATGRAGAERAGQAVKDAGVAGQARGREGGGKTGANELKAKERAEEREEKTEASTHSKFPFQQMSSIASNRKLTPLQVLYSRVVTHIRHARSLARSHARTHARTHTHSAESVLHAP